MDHLLKIAWNILNVLFLVSAIWAGLALAEFLAPKIFPWLRKPRQGRGPDRP